MDNHNPNIQDDLEVEITPLEPTVSPHLSRPARFSGKYLLPERQRALALSASVILSLVLLLSIVLPGSLPTLRSLTTKLFTAAPVPTPASTRQVLRETNRFYLDVNIPWTQVFLDGHLLSVPRLHIDPPLQLKSGRHSLEWRAAPFEVQSCVITIPFSVHDSCPFLTHESSEHQSALLISLNQSLDTLSGERKRSLIDAAQKAFTSISATVPVRVGELYYTNMHGNVSAKEPLQATLRYDFMRDPLLNQPYALAGIPCTQLCIVPEQVHLPQMQHLAPSEWLAVAFISL
ncbi:MAG: hypothetical protein M3Z24_16765, partial [Chloroflexota bacterium]|nr:hypothetical protein [Chloroflexota bacterium]